MQLFVIYIRNNQTKGVTMLKTVKQVWHQPGTKTVKAIVEYFIDYEIVNDTVVKKAASFYVCGPGEFEWCDWLHDWDLNLSSKHPAYKPSEAARLVNKFTGLSITYKDIRNIVDGIIENLQNQHNYKVFQQKCELIGKDIEKIMTDAVRKITKKYHVSFEQEETEYSGCYEDFNIITHSFKGESNGHDFTVDLNSVLEKVYENLKKE